MTEQTRQAFKALISSREEIAHNHLKENPQFLEVCAQQEKSEKIVEQLLQRFDKEDRIKISDHYEGEVYKTNFEITEAYIQGMRDCFKLMKFLGGQNEVEI